MHLADNKVNYREWIKKLHVVYTEIEFAHRETEDWLEMAIQEVPPCTSPLRPLAMCT